MSSSFSAPSPGLGAAAVAAINHPGPCLYKTFSPFADTANPLIPLRKGSVLRVVKSNFETVTGVETFVTGGFDRQRHDSLPDAVQINGHLDGLLLLLVLFLPFFTLLSFFGL